MAGCIFVDYAANGACLVRMCDHGGVIGIFGYVRKTKKEIYEKLEAMIWTIEKSKGRNSTKFC